MSSPPFCATPPRTNGAPEWDMRGTFGQGRAGRDPGLPGKCGELRGGGLQIPVLLRPGGLRRVGNSSYLRLELAVGIV